MNIIPHGQAWQDIFALEICGSSSTYMELGANHPIQSNNTYNLAQLGWTGISFDNFGFEPHFEPLWKQYRPNDSLVLGDALHHDYSHIINQYGFSSHFGYLQIDIDPTEANYEVLKLIFDSGLTFDCITFEHNREHPTEGPELIETGFEKRTEEYFMDNGYKIAVPNVRTYFVNEIFETWYVRNDIDYPLISQSAWAERIKNG